MTKLQKILPVLVSLFLLLFISSCVEKEGCTCEFSENFDPEAEVDNGSCLGCTDSGADNFNPCATVNDGKCFTTVLGCTDASAFNFNSSANTDDGSCIAVVRGCTNSAASNFNPNANTDDGSCVFITAPGVSTGAASEITNSTAKVTGSISNDGNGSISVKGVVWSTSSSPTVNLSTKTSNGTGTSSFTAMITNLEPGTTYFARAYATNEAGTGYGDEITFTTLSLSNLSIDFDGINDFVNIPDNSTLDLTNIYTIEAWINIDDYVRLGGIVSKYQTNAANGYLLRLSGSAPYDEISFDGMETADLNLELNKWYHVAAVNNNGARTLYINGSKVPLQGTPDFNSASPNNNPLRIGVDFNSRFFNGTIDEVRIWNIARTQEQIDDNWDQDLNGDENGLVAYYPMSSPAEAATSNTGLIEVLDFSENDNEGTLNNLSLSGASSNWIDNYQKPTFQIGQNYLGGKIAYLDASGHHGFIARTSDSEENQWFPNPQKDISTEDGIGTGKLNTAKIIEADNGPLCGAFCFNTAAGKVNAITDAYGDWHLPSINELRELYNNRGILGGFKQATYWSSSQFTEVNALLIQFADGSDSGTTFQGPKIDVRNIRAVRDF